MAAGNLERGNNSVAQPKTFYCGSHGLYCSAEFVTENISFFQFDHGAYHQVQWGRGDAAPIVHGIPWRR